MIPRPAIFKWRQTEPGIILCAVRWYLRYSLSLRDVEELLAERGLSVDHTTVWRWVQYYGCDYRKLGPRATSFFEGRCGFPFGGSSATVPMVIVPGLQGVGVRDSRRRECTQAERSLFARSEMSVAKLAS
jgi:hypothetical protein